MARHQGSQTVVINIAKMSTFLEGIGKLNASVSKFHWHFSQAQRKKNPKIYRNYQENSQSNQSQAKGKYL